MPAPTRLSDIEIQRLLGQLTGWSRRGDTLVKSYTLPTFMAAIDLVNRVARLAESADHHPDIAVKYTKVTFTLSTHSAGGITAADLRLAAEIEESAIGGPDAIRGATEKPRPVS